MSTNLNLDQITTGQSNKEAGVNTMSGQIDAALTEQLSCDLSAGNKTITNAEMRRNVNFIASGVATSGRSITFPAIKRLFSITNPSGSTNSIDIKVGTTTIALAVGETRMFYADGTTNGLTSVGQSAPALSTLSDVTITSAVNEDILSHDGTNWKNRKRWKIQTTQTDVDYTLVLADAFSVVPMSSSSPHNLTVPQNSSVAFPLGTEIEVVQMGTGAVTIVAGSGATVVSSASLASPAQYSKGYLRKIATNTWYFIWSGAGGGGGGSSTLAGLTDVNLTSPANGAPLVYDTGTSKWIDGTPPIGYTLINEQYLTGSGTYTPTAGTSLIELLLIASGGNGAGASATGPGEYSAGTGGSGGGVVYKKITSVEASYTYSVGAQPSSPGTGAGAAGNATTFTGTVLGTLTAGAGVGGTLLPNSSSQGTLSTPQSSASSGGDVNLSGDGGYISIRNNGGDNVGGKGGDSPLGTGGVQTVLSSAAGVDGSGFGAGGSGAVNRPSQSARNGGRGTVGTIRVREYALATGGTGAFGVPAGGALNTTLIKKSTTDGDFAWRMGHPMNEALWNFPTLSGLTTGNIPSGGSITVNSTYGGIDFVGPGQTSLNKNMWAKASKTGAFTAICCIRVLWPHKRNYMSAGIWVADATTFGGRWESWVISSEAEYSQYRFGNTTAGSNTQDTYISRTDWNSGVADMWRDFVWLKLVSDASNNRKFYISYNGVDWIYLGTGSAWATADSVGMVFNVNHAANSNDSANYRAHFVHWSLT